LRAIILKTIEKGEQHLSYTCRYKKPEKASKGDKIMKKKLLSLSILLLLTFNILAVLDLNMIEITIAQADHDVAVINVTPSPTSVKTGELVNITVIVENQGTESETFNVTTYYDTTAIETQNVVNLASGANTTLTFTWNTTSLFYNLVWHPGTYTISTKASTVPGEDYIEDNTLVSPSTVRVSRSPFIGVVPHNTVNPNLTIGTDYAVSIYTDYNGSDITGYQFALSYNPNVLHGINVTNGDLITNDTAVFDPGTFNNTAGELLLPYAYFNFLPPDPAPLTSGPGILANVTFTVVGEGDSDITLVKKETELKGYTEEGYGILYNIVDEFRPTLGHIMDGYFRNKEVTHDVAVISVTPEQTSVQLGDLVNITVVVENQGTVTETFDVTIDRSLDKTNWWRIGMKTLSSLAIGANMSITFTWNTTGVSTGTYAIRAVTSIISGEGNIEDNTLESDDTVTVVRSQAPPGLPVELIIIAIVVAVGIVVFAYVVKRMRAQPKPEA